MKHARIMYTDRMCLIVFEWAPGTDHWLRLSANRDEFYPRPTRPLQQWPEIPGLWAGKDLEQGGTWLGVTEQGRWAALTNVRAPGVGPANPKSRGELALNYLTSAQDPQSWLNEINPEHYAPFNLLVGTPDTLCYLGSYPEIVRQTLPAGRYSLSNAQLNSPWPKAILALEQLADAPHDAPLAGLLKRREPWPDDDLPETGVPMLWERLLSAQFIRAPGYGTRCSTGLNAYASHIELQEITWNEAGEASERNEERIEIKDR